VPSPALTKNSRASVGATIGRPPEEAEEQIGISGKIKRDGRN